MGVLVLCYTTRIRFHLIHIERRKMPTFFDITHSLKNETTIWPGDEPIDISRIHECGVNAESTVRKLVMTSHTGTHIDAPAHFVVNGDTVDQIPLNVLIGECTVIETQADVIDSSVLDSLDIPKNTKRLLIKTQNSMHFTGTQPFDKNYVGLNANGAEWVVENGIQLVGIDYLSIACFSEIQATHNILLNHRIAVLESLYLKEVPQGVYTLIALPLKLEDGDGAPSRVVLYTE
jgi:arylformamidase